MEQYSKFFGPCQSFVESLMAEIRELELHISIPVCSGRVLSVSQQRSEWCSIAVFLLKFKKIGNIEIKEQLSGLLCRKAMASTNQQD